MTDVMQINKNKHWLIENRPSLIRIRRWSRRPVTVEEIRHLQDHKRPQLLSQLAGLTAEGYKEAPGRLGTHLLRNGWERLDYKNEALRRRPLALQSEWPSTANPTKVIQVFSWDAGNL